MKLAKMRAMFGVGAVLVGTLLTWSRASWAEIGEPTAADHQITLALTAKLPTNHLSRHALDDEISERALKLFLKSLDPFKLYFYQSDIDSFMERKTQLDDMARKGDVRFAYYIFKGLVQRIDEKVALAEKLLQMDHDFTVDEDMVREPDATVYARTTSESEDMWRKRIKFDILVQKADGKTLEESREKLTRRYQSFAKRMKQTDRDELLEMFLTSLTTAYDPHTSYMSPSTLENFDIVMRLQLEGIGAALQSEDGYTVVKQIVPGGPADRDGRLKTEDRVIGVGQGENGELEDVVDMKLSDVVKRIRGKRNTTVRLQVIPEGQTAPITYNIVRDAIELKDGEAHSAVFEMGEKADGTPYRLGIIDLPSFYMDMEGARKHREDYKSTTRDVKKILKEFRGQNVDAVVMDLRQNGGGSLTEAINLTGLFIDQGPIVQVKGFDGEVQHYDDMDQGTEWDGPLTVLISKLSASASEIFAGAIQDYGRGLVIGDHATHGKGTVQTLSDLGAELFRGPNSPKMGALKITMQQFYRPNGDSTQNRGVLADLELPSITTHLPNGESDLDFAVPFDQVPAADYTRADLLDRTMMQQLASLSKQRVDQSEDFQKLAKKIEKYTEQRDRKTVPLNEEKFMAERKSLDADKEEEDALKEPDSAGGRKIERNFYLDEAMAVTVDYLRMFRVAKAR